MGSTPPGRCSRVRPPAWCRRGCWPSRSTNGAPSRCGRWRSATAGIASPSTKTCSGGRGSCWPLPRRRRDRPEGAGARPAAGAERGVQDAGPGERPDARGRDLQKAPGRGRAERPGHRTRGRREPGGTPVAEAARKVVLHFPQELAPAEELFLFLAARAHVVRTVIRPALEAGQVVLADRFELSTMAYQVAGGGLPYDEVVRANH